MTTVSITRCSSYDRDAVLAAVRDALQPIGGIGAFVRPGARVLLKPNLLKASRPEAAVTTHPEVLRAVIRLVNEAGALPLVGDSPGIGDLRRVCDRAGILQVIEQEGAHLVAFDEAVAVKGRGRFQRIEVARAVRDADAVINLPKLKTHGMTTLTGAVKNLFGCVPGKRKVQWHFNTGVDHAAFVRMLVELAAAVGPVLTIMDAVVAMEGNGPGSGDPRSLGVILAGSDPVAVDAVAGALVSVAPERLPVLRAAAEAGWGEPRIDHIRTAGVPVRSVAVSDFRLPPREHTEWRLPEWMKRSLKDALTTRPVIDPVRCIRCGICQAECPQQVIAVDGRDLTIDHRRCIRCFCCQEFCPQGAISVGRGWLLRILGR